MSEKIEPALSPELWAILRSRNNRGLFAIITLEGGNDREIGALDADIADTIEAEDLGRAKDDVKRNVAAIAALNDELPDSDPRKITREKIAMMRHTAWQVPEGYSGNIDLSDFADALESYLPPITP